MDNSEGQSLYRSHANVADAGCPTILLEAVGALVAFPKRRFLILVSGDILLDSSTCIYVSLLVKV